MTPEQTTPTSASPEGQHPKEDSEDLQSKYQKLERDNKALQSKCQELENRKKGLEQELDDARQLGKWSFLVGIAVILAGAGLIVWTILLRVKTLKERELIPGVLRDPGMLGHGEFVAGIAGGCALILAVLVVAVLWSQSTGGQSSLGA